MARMTIDPEGSKRERLNTTARPMIVRMARETRNAAQFLERSTDACLGVLAILKEENNPKAALERIEAEMGQWTDYLSDSPTFASLFPPPKKSRSKPAARRHAG